MKPRRFVAWVTAVSGTAAVVLATGVHYVAHPEWTQPQALRELWPLYIGGSILAVAGVYWAAIDK